MEYSKNSTANGMTLYVPGNDYVQPTEARVEVVQALIYAFLTNNNYCKVYHPHNWFSNEPKFYEAHTHISTVSPLFCGYKRTGEDFVRIRGCEMARAFQALRGAGIPYVQGRDGRRLERLCVPPQAVPPRRGRGGGIHGLYRLTKITGMKTLNDISQWLKDIKTERKWRKIERRRKQLRSELAERIQLKEWDGLTYIAVDGVPMVRADILQQDCISTLHKMRNTVMDYKME